MPVFNALFGLATHSQYANTKGAWPCQDNAASTAIVGIAGGSNGTLLGGDNTSDKSVAGPNSWLPSAIRLNGTDDRLSFPLSALGSNDATAILWVKLAADPPATDAKTGWARLGHDIVDVSGAASHYPYLDGSIYCSDFRASNSTTISRVTVGNPTPALDQWRKLCIKTTPGAGGWEFRLDGSTIATATGLNPLYTGGAWIVGQSAASTIHYLDGDVAFLAVFDAHLSDSDEAEAFGGPEPVTSSEQGLSGTAQEGATLTATPAGWALPSPFGGGTNGTITYGYQWTRSDDDAGTNEADISGATSATYTPISDDVGKCLRCRIAASNDGGNDPDADTATPFSAAVAPATIAPDDASHGHTAASPAITQTHAVAPDEASHGHTAESPTVTQTHAVAPDEANHGHTAESPTVTQAHQIAPDEASHGHTADSPSVTQTHAVAPADAAHAHTAESPTVTQSHQIAPAEAAHAHTAESPTITQTHQVAPDSATHGHTADSPTVTLAPIRPASCRHGHRATMPVITQSHQVAPASATHGHTAGSPAVTVGTGILPHPVAGFTLPKQHREFTLPEQDREFTLPEQRREFTLQRVTP